MAKIGAEPEEREPPKYACQKAEVMAKIGAEPEEREPPKYACQKVEVMAKIGAGGEGKCKIVGRQ